MTHLVLALKRPLSCTIMYRMRSMEFAVRIESRFVCSGHTRNRWIRCRLNHKLSHKLNHSAHTAAQEMIRKDGIVFVASRHIAAGNGTLVYVNLNHLGVCRPNPFPRLHRSGVCRRLWPLREWQFRLLFELGCQNGILFSCLPTLAYARISCSIQVIADACSGRQPSSFLALTPRMRLLEPSE